MKVWAEYGRSQDLTWAVFKRGIKKMFQWLFKEYLRCENCDGSCHRYRKHKFYG